MFITTALLVVQWSLPSFNPILFAWAMAMAVPVAVISHNHNHLKMWKNGTLNTLTDYWLTLFYGFPVFAWIPTHNMNHHKFTNREGDYTITYRYSERNNLLTLLTYPTISGIFQQKPTRDYLKAMWSNPRHRKRFWAAISQYVVLALFLAVTLWIDWRKTVLYIIIPQQFSLFSVLCFNYLQHVHADEESEFNHSRNIVGPGLNLFLFNNGFHTAHHNKPGLHWSLLPQEHARIADKVDPRLNDYSFWWLIARTYILGPFSRRFRSQSMRLERMATSSES